MDPNLRLAVERVKAWHLARLQAQFLSQAAENAPEGDGFVDSAAAEADEPRSAPAGARGGDTPGARSH